VVYATGVLRAANPTGGIGGALWAGRYIDDAILAGVHAHAHVQVLARRIVEPTAAGHRGG